jgi:thiamine biosynthesis lipoprotein
MSPMIDLETVEGTAVAEWEVWTTTARVVVTDPSVLDAAVTLIRTRLEEVDLAASRFRADSEVRQIARSQDREHTISPLLADLVAAGLQAAQDTDGAVDPTLGTVLTHLGYRSEEPGSVSVVAPAPGIRWTAARRVTWRDIHVGHNTLRMPPGTLLDLGASAKAWTADRCAEDVASRFGCGAMVSLGGDLRVAGAPPTDGWNILVQDGADEPASRIGLTGAEAVATSSTLHRRWLRHGQQMHHLIDPLTGYPARPVWRTVTVAAPTCLMANTLTTQAMVLGELAILVLAETGLPARLVDASGEVIAIGGWPA